eukprot:TRINITY_DN4978_c0_g1_i1.p1 TRINITY_DN4978_c0_g1~~TRINITY_DN4978_c0_g1_i1.p1  ORF type:complete len:173 (-),score=30.58 TRINITY_DN4978_c0_g1_i1:18-536(-)
MADYVALSTIEKELHAIENTVNLVGEYYNCANCGVTLYSGIDRNADIPLSNYAVFKKEFTEGVVQFSSTYSFGLPRESINCANCSLLIGHKVKENNTIYHTTLPGSLVSGNEIELKPEETSETEGNGSGEKTEETETPTNQIHKTNYGKLAAIIFVAAIPTIFLIQYIRSKN